MCFQHKIAANQRSRVNILIKLWSKKKYFKHKIGIFQPFSAQNPYFSSIILKFWKNIHPTSRLHDWIVSRASDSQLTLSMDLSFIGESKMDPKEVLLSLRLDFEVGDVTSSLGMSGKQFTTIRNSCREIVAF